MELQGRKMKILIIGDFHIPERASEIPDWILKKIEEEKNFDLILCTGDLTDKEIIRKLQNFGKVKCVQGNMDYENFPEMEIISAGNLKILLLHGSGIHPRGDLNQLEELRKKFGADIVVHGHTHKMSLDFLDKEKTKLALNPGTATGVWGGSSDSTSQTFIILLVDKSDIEIKFFEDGKLKNEVRLRIQKNH